MSRKGAGQQPLAFFYTGAQCPVRSAGLRAKKKVMRHLERQSLEKFTCYNQKDKQLKRYLITEYFRSAAGHVESVNAL